MFQYLQLVKGLSPIVAGLWTLPSFVAFIVGSMLAPALVSRVRPVVVMAPGLAVAALGESLPEGISPEAADTARDTLGGAVAVADGRPGPFADELLEAAREAFSDGMQVAALTSAVLAVLAAVVAAGFLRGLRAAPAPAGVA